MWTTTWTMVLCGLLAAPGSAAGGGAHEATAPSGRLASPEGSPTIRLAAYQRGRSGRGLTVRWLGQDGKDFTGPAERLEPDDIQDIHLALGGLDSRREITFVDITAPGGHRWQFHPTAGIWPAHLQRQKGARSAEIWFNPVELAPGLVCHVLVRYDDDSTEEADVRSRRASPGLRVAAAAVRAQWIGQDRQDQAGAGACVGPDGLQDARIHLSGLSTRNAIKAIRVESAAGSRWEFGLNTRALANAEFLKDAKDARQGDVFFQPDRDLAGSRIRVSIAYEHGQPDVLTIAAGRCDPKLRMPQTPMPKVEAMDLSADWLGQDGSNPARPGDVHVVLGNLPGSGRIAAMGISDMARAAWQYQANDKVGGLADATPGTLDFRPRPDRRSADVYFTPSRDLKGETFSVCVVTADGRTWIGQFAGGAVDLGRLAAKPDARRAQARPGDDLQALIDRNGTVVLAPGTYRLRHPLVINRPTILKAAGKVTLIFAQDPNDRPWGTVIKVKASNSTLEGFAVRFEGRVRWDNGVSYGPAVIGMTEHTEPGYNDLKSQVVFRNLDLEIPPADDPAQWTEAIRLFRLVGASSGVIANNRLRGGVIELFHGPWNVVDNEFRGTPPGTFSHSCVTGHFTHDLLVRGNRTSSPAPSGKVWRFLVITGCGDYDRVERNVIEGIGAREGDTIPWMNAPEVILTENYWLKYEGRAMAISGDGRTLRTGQPQQQEPQPGDTLAILDGPAAGQWRRIVHSLDRTTLVLDRPVPKETGNVSVSHGFIGEVFEANRFDLRGGRRSDAFVLAGNHYGPRIVDNYILGGGMPWRISACPTERPMIWGWSHAPYMGGVIERNVVEDAEKGAKTCVEHSQYIKTNKGRTYMSLELRDNVVRWSRPFLASRQASPQEGPLEGLVVGEAPSLDPQEFLVSASGNTLDAPPDVRDGIGLVVHAAQFNAQKVVDRRYRLPAPGGRPERRSEARSGGSRSIR